MGDNNIENVNNLILEKKTITSFDELMLLLNEYNELCTKYKNLSKFDKYALMPKITELEHILMYGIKIDNSIIDMYISSIIKFINSFGIDATIFESKLKKIDLTVSPVELLSKGRLCNYGAFISIDYSFVKFNPEGAFVGFKEPQPDFIKHVIIHEMLHSISNKTGFNYMDSFSEGMTDYFAHKISKATNIISDKYGYFERIFYMFGIMIGDGLLFEDYVTNVNEMKNLNSFISSLGISENEFREFKTLMDKLLNLKYNLPKDVETLSMLENKVNEFIFNRIIMPYCSFDKEVAIKMFENIFSDSEDTKKMLCEVQSEFKSKRIIG